MKYVFSMFCIFCCLNNLLIAQSVYIEDVKKEVKKANGTQKVDGLIDIAHYYLGYGYKYGIQRRNGNRIMPSGSKDEKKLLNYIEEAIVTAGKENYLDGLAIAYYYLGEYYLEEEDFEKAETAYLNWYETRIKEGDKDKIYWTYPMLSYFYFKKGDNIKSYEFSEKTRFHFGDNKTVSETYTYLIGKWNEYSRYYNGTWHPHDLQLMLSSLEEVKSFFEAYPTFRKKTVELNYMDDGFEFDIKDAIQKRDYDEARSLGKKWLSARSIFVNNYGLYQTARRIARRFKEDNEDSQEYALEFLSLSITYAKAYGDSEIIRDAYNNAIYCTRVMDLPVASFQYIINSKIYNDVNWHHYRGALNGCAYRAEYNSKKEEIQQIIVLLEEWKETLDVKKDDHIIRWCSSQIERFVQIIED